MKKAIFFVLFIGMAFAHTSCNSEAKTKAINDFTKTYFPNAEVIANIQDGLGYDVTLNDYTQISFEGGLMGKLEWDEVDCKHANTSVPSTLVPSEIANYVNRSNGGQPIVKLAKKDYGGWEIELANGMEIEFDKKFNVIDFDD